jgi:hypothetical protein
MAKSNDFEVHELGTTMELKLCRALIEDMTQISKQYGRGIFPSTVANKLDNIVAFYASVIEDERYENGI